MMFDCFGFKVPKKAVKEEFLQEQLYVEDQYLYLEEIPQIKKKDEEVERGVVVIDLF